MRLRSIKLAGFKSFVDPTTVNFPSNMAAVVGPNGCGKSNIIDAVRWVMGESSAKNLRGESMTDVIFNGSNSRKPVSQASIELIFDNSDHTLVGEYASYAEISIRRRVTREGQNTYFLNGTKCRRRDITDIFLGTGLGPRSYSIIEQGMISKLIEARPEDLRHYIEEAAGISKYKERRRETENRIRRTQENLARLTDLREELERQLERLHRQAQSAERFQAFKQEERQLRAQLQAVRWRELDERVAQREKVIRDQETALEALTAEQRQADAGIERLRDGHHELSEAFNLVQGRFYSLGGDIARLEQTIQHGQQRQRQLQDDLREAEQARSEAESHLEHDRVLLATFEEELAMLEPEEEAARAQGEESAMAVEEAELSLADWQQRWEQLSAASVEPQREADVQQSRIRSLEQSLERGHERQRRLRDERTLLGEDGPSERLVMLEEQIAEDELLLESLAEQESQVAEDLQRLRDELLGLAGEQSQRQGELQRLEGRIASLEALQQAALAPTTGVAEWLAAEGLAQAPQLADEVQVTPGWELAVETVLGSDLQAVCLDDPASLRLDTFASGALNLALPGSAAAAAGSLLEQVQAPRDLSPWLGQVLVAGSYDEALARRVGLAPGQSLITPEGYWISRHFLRVRRAEAAEGSVLARGRELEELQARRLELSEALALQEEWLEERRAAQQRLESERDDARRRQQQEQQRLAESRAQLSAQQARAEQLSIRRRQLEADLKDVEQQLGREQEELGECRLRLQDALDAMAVDTEQRAQLQDQREGQRQAVESARQRQRQAQDQLHQLTVRLTTLRAQRQSTFQALERLELQTARLGERCEQLNLNLEEGGEPLDELRLRLEELLERRLQVDEEMRTARLALEDADRELRDFERRRLQAEQQATLLRAQLEQHRLEWQGLATRRSGFAEQLAADGYDLPTVIATLPAEAGEAAWEEQLEAVAARIARLGPINLAAIDEYQQQAERKHYLDAQNADLVEALETLESVIRKIDRETRNRFKDTFDQINHGLQALFPKVFGGGSAYLELTGEDLLDTGVAIMARPPGKKNSTIHLLSGGEKALTALALVFAIFQLNPAPFCMLDEVDAPLDDANVGRYARLVKSMSEKVQFIYITHNKIAMEMAEQLLGVTMHEPGCSRLVAVDVEEAVAMVDA